MKAALLGLLASVSLGTYAHAQGSNVLDQATDQAQLTTPFDGEHVDLDKGVFYDDGQARPESDYMARPGGGGGGGGRGGGGGGGFHPAPGGGGGHGGGGGGFHPAPGGGGHGGGGFHPGPGPGRPGGGGGFHPAPGRPGPGRPGTGPRPGPGHGPGRPGTGPRPGPGHGPGRPVPPGHGPRPGPGHGWGPGHHGGFGHGWHPGHGGYFHNPRWHSGWHWRRDFHPHWWYAGVAFPLWFWDVDAPAGYWQCMAFNQGGDDAEPYLGYGPDQDEAAFNAIDACGGEDTCYIPPGYCQLH